jgi:hypothetical protein
LGISALSLHKRREPASYKKHEKNAGTQIYCIDAMAENTHQPKASAFLFIEEQLYL